MMCQAILTPLTYLNVEEIFWKDLTCHMKERVWPLQKRILYRDVPRASTNDVLRRNTNHNVLLRNKKTQIMRLHMMCLAI